MAIEPNPAVVVGQPVVMVRQPPAVIVTHEFGDKPLVLTCPRCHTRVITDVRHEVSCGRSDLQLTAGNSPSFSGTWICSGIICVFCFLFFWMPFLIHQCQEARHICPNCGSEIGKKVFITA